MTQLVLALVCLLALNTNAFGFQTDEKDPAPSATAEQKEDDDDDQPTTTVYFQQLRNLSREKST